MKGFILIRFVGLIVNCSLKGEPITGGKMQVERLKFLKAIGFVKHAISNKDDAGAMNCLHVRFEQDRCILTGTDGSVSKKAIIVGPQEEQISIDESAGKSKKQRDSKLQFMIPYADLMSFETLVDEHKQKAKKLQKDDTRLLMLEIGDTYLESFGTEHTYQQPAFDPIDIEGKFQITMETVNEVFILPGRAAQALKGFDKVEDVQVVFSGDDDKNQILFIQEATDFEALLMPSQSGEQPGEGTEEE
jgi:hypothetical protein